MITVNVFIDWDSARRIIKRRWAVADENTVSMKERVLHVEECFSTIQSRIAEKLPQIVADVPMRVMKTRIYHGWHRGKTLTTDRIAWDEAIPKLRAVVKRSISFLPDVEYGNVLSCGGTRMPLLDTLRHHDDGPEQQKMVDTALVADLLSYCRSESKNFQRNQRPQSMAIIIGDDDDLLPGAFVSEQWGLPTYVFRVTRITESKHVNTTGITYKL